MDTVPGITEALVLGVEYPDGTYWMPLFVTLTPGTTLDDDLRSRIELNEAFAAQAVAVIRDAKLDPAQVNPYGGAIALGHPVGATGAILSLRVAKDMVRRDLELGVVTMCIGGGQALAALFRRV